MTHRSSLSKRRWHLLLLLGALLILVAIFVFNLHLIKTPCQLASVRPRILGPAINDLEVKITSPEDCSLNLPAGKHIPVEGTYSGNLAGREIWVLAYASDHEYYPQSSDPCKMLPAEASGGHWTTTLFDLTAEQIDIVVTVTDDDSEASQYFKEWVKQAGCPEPGEKFPGGISNLPDGLTEMDAITVRTKSAW